MAEARDLSSFIERLDGGLARMDLAVDGIVWSAFGTSGQRCTATSRVIVHESRYGELEQRLVERA